jgi:hypothetical protein
MTATITRRGLAGWLAGAAHAAARQPAPPPQQPAADDLEAARAALGRNRNQIAKVPVGRFVEPCFRFEA